MRRLLDVALALGAERRTAVLRTILDAACDLTGARYGAIGSLTNRLIARELVLSEKTVKAHVSAVLGRLGVADRTQVAFHAVRAGMV